MIVLYYLFTVLYIYIYIFFFIFILFFWWRIFKLLHGGQTTFSLTDFSAQNYSQPMVVCILPPIISFFLTVFS